MKTTIITAALAAAILVAPATANAQEAEGCETVDYQGAPLEMCPPQEPDPTNCYTGWYQGAPIEVCMPTGVSLPEGTVYHDGTPWAGEPVVTHVSKDYVAPVATTATPTTTPLTPKSEPVRTWLDELQAALVANGGLW